MSFAVQLNTISSTKCQLLL